MLFDMSNGVTNGFELAVMSSADAADTVIKEFKRRYHRGQDPTSLLNSIVDDINVDDIFPEDCIRIKKAIMNYLGELNESIY